MDTVFNSQLQYRHKLYSSTCPASVQFEKCFQRHKNIYIPVPYSFMLLRLWYIFTYL